MVTGIQRIFSLLTAVAIALAGSRCVCASTSTSAEHAIAVTEPVALLTPTATIAGSSHACCAHSKTADWPAPANHPKPTPEKPSPVGCNHCKLGQSAPAVGDSKSLGDGAGSAAAFQFVPLVTSFFAETNATSSRPPTTDPPWLRDQLTLLSLHCSLLN